MVNKYVFNYLNPFTDSYWMANGADKDSVNYVKETASRYMLEEGSTSGYGYGYGKLMTQKRVRYWLAWVSLAWKEQTM